MKLETAHDPYAVIRLGAYRLFLSARFLMTLGFQMLALAVSWQVYAMTKDPLSLGLIGLAEAIPSISVALYAGHIADRKARKTILLLFTAVTVIGACLLYSFTFQQTGVLQAFGVLPLYAVVFLIGISRGFLAPAIFALQAQIVPRHLYSNAATWNSTVWHVAAITGPALAGLLYGISGPAIVYLLAGLMLTASFISILRIPNYPAPRHAKEESLYQSLSTGIRFVFSHQIILSAITLDLFAVLFGGAVALLPIFASEILHCGPQGLGLLRAAPAVGAVIMALFMAYNPPHRHAGTKLLLAVTGFGLCMLFFAVSTNFYLSLLLLVLSGIFDNVSVVIRSTILQSFTPDHMRGRVSAVNNIFIGSSNEIGAFESGVTARLMGTVPSVIFGGGMTLLVVVLARQFSPKLRKLDLSKPEEMVVL